MIRRPISGTVAVLMALIAALHVARLVRGTTVEVGGQAVPMGLSLVAALLFGALAVLLWREASVFVERRREPRRRAVHLISLRQSSAESAAGVPVILGRTLQLNSSGATVETSEPLEIGAEIDVELAVEAEIVAARGTIIHVDQDSEGRYSVGVKFSTDTTV
jgi:hypothetical protein